MCGIAAILRIYPSGTTPRGHFESIPEAWLDALDESIKHRGPDGQGRFRDRVVRADGCTMDVAFVHRRLSIIDHKGGAQPMLDIPLHPGEGEEMPGDVQPPLPLIFHGPPDAAVHYRTVHARQDLLAVIFNGCIYNHRELRRELEAAGHKFHTDHSDTEVLLHGWRRWGKAIQTRLEGMFAFVLWDRQAESLALARDLWGEKPLYVRYLDRDGGRLYIWSSVASESSRLGTILGRTPLRSNEPCGPVEWLRMGWAAAGPVKAARLEPPGLLQVLSKPRSSSETSAPPPVPEEPEPDWIRDPRREEPLPPSDLPRDAGQFENEFDRLLEQAVRRRMEADVPLGVLLSGGVDSSLVAHYARRAVGEIDTFTVRMPQAEYDESAHALRVAEHLGTRHHSLDCAPRPADDLVRLIEMLGLPFGDSSLLPTYWVCRAAREAVKVALAGDGGDEMFFGYDRYFAPLRFAMPALVARPLNALLSIGAHPKSWRARAARMIDAAGGYGYIDLLSVFPESMLRRLVSGPLGPGDVPSIWLSKGHNTEGARWSGLHDYLPDDLLRKTDTASMAVGLEIRAPFLDSNLSRLAMSTPVSILAPHKQRKWLLRQIAKRYLPAQIVDRPKMGFAIPIGEWFRTDYGQMRTLLMDLVANASDPFPADFLGIELNRRYIARLINEHLRGVRDHSQRLYMLVVLAIWCRCMHSRA